METLNENLKSLENQFLFFNMAEKDQPENLSDNFIQHKIDSKNLSQIKWPKLMQLLQECIFQYQSCHYELRIYNVTNGNGDESISEILSKIKKISESLNCTCDIIKTKQGIFGIFFEFFLESKEKKNDKTKKNNINLNKYIEIKIGTFGEESSGKSTTTSVLINNSYDDGNGLMSKKNYKSQHEILCGKSLFISHLILGIDSQNKPINNTELDELIKKSSKFINIYDMGGSDKAMKNTLSLISPDYIDYALLFIDYKNGATENTRKLFSLNNSVHIPMICIITMIDLIKNQNEKELLDFIERSIKYLSSVNPHLQSLLIRNTSDVNDYISKLNNNGIENFLPVICISNVKGNNIELLKYLITLLPTTASRTIPLLSNSFENNLISSPINQFDVHEHFIVNGKTILGGVVSKGIIKKNDTYYFGPNKLGNFKYVKVETIHCKKQEVDVIYEGQFSSLSLTGSNYDPNEVSKGMCLIGTNTAFVPKAVRKFKADVWWIGEEQVKEIKYKYEPVVIINHIRETCKLINMNKNQNFIGNKSYTEGSTSEITSEFSMNSKTGSNIASSIELEDENFHFTKKKKKIKTNLKEEIFWLSRDEKMELIFEFKNFQKYINEGQTIIINDNTFKAFGIITKVFYPEDEKLLFINKPLNNK
jgi:elongation factor 1-alpha